MISCVLYICITEDISLTSVLNVKEHLLAMHKLAFASER